jgi:hypothetical protein
MWLSYTKQPFVLYARSLIQIICRLQLQEQRRQERLAYAAQQQQMYGQFSPQYGRPQYAAPYGYPQQQYYGGGGGGFPGRSGGFGGGAALPLIGGLAGGLLLGEALSGDFGGDGGDFGGGDFGGDF